MFTLHPGNWLSKGNKRPGLKRTAFHLPLGPPFRVGVAAMFRVSGFLLSFPQLLPSPQRLGPAHTTTALSCSLSPHTAFGKKDQPAVPSLGGLPHWQTWCRCPQVLLESGWSVQEGDPEALLPSTCSPAVVRGHLARKGCGHCFLCPKVPPKLTCVSIRVCMCTHDCAVCIMYVYGGVYKWHMCAHMCINVWGHMCVCMCMCEYAYSYACECEHVCVCMIFVCACVSRYIQFHPLSRF